LTPRASPGESEPFPAAEEEALPDFLYNWPIWISGLAILFLFLLFSETCLRVVRRIVLPRLKMGEQHSLLGGVMVSAMVLLYGLVAALISVNVYDTYAEVSRIVSREATSLAALYRDVSSYPEPARTRLQAAIRDYMHEVIDEAWPLQHTGRMPTHGVVLTDAIQTELTSFEPGTEGQKLLHAETLRAYNEFIDARNLRVDANRDGLPGLMWAILLIGAALCLFAACFFAVEDRRSHSLFLGLLAAIFAMIFFMTFAWDRPYRGELGLTAEPYQIVYDHLMKRHETGP
jgi:hypothetical protein